ncbi:MAG: TatD family hydrolase [Desulfomonilaceae bacterium]
MDAQSAMNDVLSDGLYLIDTHAHLQLDPLVRDPAGVVARAQSQGVKWIISVGIELEDSRNMLRIVEQFAHVYACLGFHPHNAVNASDRSLVEMRKLAQHPKVVGYGEIGLDFYRNISPREKQVTAFRDQIALAKDLGLPLVIHLRNAYEEGLSILEEFAPFPRGGVIHCFSGSFQDARRALDLGFHISIPGTITYKKNEAFRDIVKQTPRDRILLETDCPFLAPEPLRGRDNEPAYLIYTARKVAELWDVDMDAAAQITTQNAFSLFGMPQRNDMAYEG